MGVYSWSALGLFSLILVNTYGVFGVLWGRRLWIMVSADLGQLYILDVGCGIKALFDSFS